MFSIIEEDTIMPDPSGDLVIYNFNKEKERGSLSSVAEGNCSLRLRFGGIFVLGSLLL